MGNQQPTTSKSSSSSSTKQETDKVKDGQEEKKLKTGSQPENENETEVETKSFIDELPPEMLMIILKHLDTKSLKSSRLMNRKWNQISTEILKSREDLEIVVYYYELQKKCLVGPFGELLQNFMKCFKSSKNFPYTRFIVHIGEDSALLDHEDWIMFISDFGKNIKGLKIMSPAKSEKDLIKFAEKLRNLLLNQLPNLEEFLFHSASFVLAVDGGWRLEYKFIPNSRAVQLFPTSAENLNADLHDTTTSTAAQFPNLKVIYLDGFIISNYTEIVTDLLLASVNLQKILSLDKSTPFAIGVENFPLFHALGKLHCLKAAEIHLTTEFLSQFKEKRSVALVFKLEKLKLHVKSLYNDDDKNSWSTASLFISNLLASSRDTLKILETGPLGFLPGLQLPKFSKLASLSVESIGNEENPTVLPSGSNLTEIFPVLKSLALEIPWTDLFPHKQVVTCTTNLKSLKIPGLGMTQKGIARISEICPNLKEFTMGPNSKGVSRNNFREVGKAIWTHLQQLETLHLQIYMDDSTNAFPAIDSCFTGFSGKDCAFLYDLITVEKSSEKWGSHIKISESKLEAERKNPSILDLKDLRKLTVRVNSSSSRNAKKHKEVLDKNTLTVSEKHAFQVMKNLDYKIDKIRL